MKGYKAITFKYLKNQKKRTLLTIFGIILSVALITAIGTMIVSVRDSLIKEATVQVGKHHGIIKDVGKEELDKIINNVKVDEAGIGRYEGFGIVSELTEEEKESFNINSPYRYISINSYDDKALSLLPYKLKEGRFPESPDEIAIEYWVAEYFDKEVKIGDKIKVPIGDRYLLDIDEKGKEIKMKAGPNDWGSYGEVFEQTGEKEYTVVGFIDPEYIWKSKSITEAISYIDKNNLFPGDKYNVYVKMNSLKNIHDEIYELAGVKDWRSSEANEDYDSLGKVQFNEYLLRLFGKSLNDNLNKFVIGVFIFVVSLIMVATIAVIYNSFNISILERISQFGLLRTVGATPKQIKGIVMKEAVFLSLIGIPIGLVCGVLAMKIVLYIIGFFKYNLLEGVEITYSIPVYIISSVLGILTVFLSANGPAKKAAKVSPLEAVRSTGSYRKEDLTKVKGSIIVRKILGVEGEIAYKNLRRNRKRFTITVFSIVISVALFITFSTFSDYMFKVEAIETANRTDFSIYNEYDSKNSDRMDNIYNDLIKMEDIDRIYKFRDYLGVPMLVEEEKINSKLVEADPYLQEPEREGNMVRTFNNGLITFGSENMEYLKPLLKEGSIDVEKMNEENGVLIVKTTKIYNERTRMMAILDGYDIKIGDELILELCCNEKGEEEKKKVKVMGILEKGLLDVGYGQNGGINIITTDEVLNELYKAESPDLFIEMKNQDNRENVKKHIEKIVESNENIEYIDYEEIAKEQKNGIIVTNIFLYGFVVVIALISSINIINTISTNLILRTRELAMLKAVGMDQKALKRMVSLESLYYGLYATIYGGLAGTGLTYVLHRIVLQVREFEWVIPWKNIIIACGAATLIGLLSGYSPLKRINDGVIVEKIKMEE